MSKDKRKWTPEEDRLLLAGFQAQVAKPTGKGRTINWSEVATKLAGRTNKDCRKRYLNEMARNLKKGPWSQEEDVMLKRLVARHGLAWAKIAQHMETRGADQCSKRWHHSLNPELNHRPWTEEENNLLLRALKVHGSSWKDIQDIHFPARSANNIKNQSTILARRNAKISSHEPACCTKGSPTSSPKQQNAQQQQLPSPPASEETSSPDSQSDATDVLTSKADPRSTSACMVQPAGSDCELNFEEDGTFNDYFHDVFFPGPSEAGFDFLVTDSPMTPSSMEGGPLAMFRSQPGVLDDATANSNMHAFNAATFTSTNFLTGPESAMVADGTVTAAGTPISVAAADGTMAVRDNGMDWQLEPHHLGPLAATTEEREACIGVTVNHSESSASSTDGYSQPQTPENNDIASALTVDLQDANEWALKSRMTIVIDGAAPDTLAEVMKVLIGSQAKVEFQCN